MSEDRPIELIPRENSRRRPTSSPDRAANAASFSDDIENKSNHQHVTSNVSLKTPLPPLARANWFSRLTFGWIGSLVSLGQKPILTEVDMPPISDDDNCRNLSDTMLDAWRIELDRVRHIKGATPSLWRVLFRTLKSILLISGVMSVLVAGLKIAEAILLGQFIYFFQDPQAPNRTGYLWALALIGVTMTHACLQSQYIFPARRMGFQARTGLIAVLYRKMLRLPASSLISSGEAINIISNDTQCFETLAPLLHDLWIGPTESMIVIFLLCITLGWPALIGVGIVVISVPVNAWITRQLMFIRMGLVTHRDSRIRLLSDIFHGIELIKLSAWEEPLENEANKQRNEEMQFFLQNLKYATVLFSFFSNITNVLAISTFAVYVAIGNELQPDIVFSSLALLNIVRLAVGTRFPAALRLLAECIVAARRIVSLLTLPENAPLSIDDSRSLISDPSLNDSSVSKPIMEFRNANFTWAPLTQPLLPVKSKVIANKHEMATDIPLKSNSEANNVLKNISFDLLDEELLVVVGPVGGGKSSLCMAALQEIHAVSGNAAFFTTNTNTAGRGRIGYAQQQPFLLSGTVRDNITFGEPYDPDWFARVVEACALREDLEKLSHGDMTFVGERGITLSGGQKARVALARAIYTPADYYVFDDPLSAVDPHVARHLFDQAICGLLAGRPRLLTTHQLQFVFQCDRILVLENGEITALDTPSNVLATLVEIDATDSTNNDEQGFIHQLRQYMQNESSASQSASEEVKDSDSTNNEDINNISNDNSSHYEIASTSDTDTAKDIKTEGSLETNNAVAEDQEIGTTPLNVYWQFLRFGGSIGTVILLLLITVATQGCLLATDWYLALWSGAQPRSDASQTLEIDYTILVVVSIVLSMGHTGFFMGICWNASRWMFRTMLHSILATSIHFFHSNPHGRVLNRFSKDQAHVDEQLPNVAFTAVMSIISIAGFVIVVCIINPYITIALVVLVTIFIYLRQRFARSSRQVRRIESVSRSPVYSQLSEALHGLVTLRALGVQDRFWNKFAKTQNTNSRAFFAFVALGRWIGFRLDFFGAVFLTAVTLAAVPLRSSIQAAFVGLSLSYLLQFIGLLQWAVEQSIELEMIFISVERIAKYTRLSPESSQNINIIPPANWPDQGAIEFRNMTLTYPNTTKAVLNKVSFKIKPGEKIGIVGRTGAGKSSMLTALFRLTEVTPSNCILIDDIGTSNIGLYDLRSRLAIIPQTPILFKGSLRFNLDPFQKHTDNELWNALDAAELKDKIQALPNKLDSPVVSVYLVVGERQLISLCRAILRNARIVVMDEATANVDLATDRRIQRAIRRHFQHATVMTIAHRLDTVVGAMALVNRHTYATPNTNTQEDEDIKVIPVTVDKDMQAEEENLGADRIMVLDAGEIREFDTPEALVARRSNGSNGEGWLRRMLLDAGDAGERAIELLEANWATLSNEREM
ncbi:hypothetical protein BDF19DRAFT_422368 [Syncephalis fuscata]|nr:hypothetical protein BDF19DRAFT_422368 [Syncephalis fuscata]